MKQTDFEKLLKQSLQDIPPEETDNGLETTILLARTHLRQMRRRERISFRQFLSMQIRYIGWQLWSGQCLMLLIFDQMLIQLYGDMIWNSASSTARLLFCVSTLVAMMALPLLYRSRKYRMQEIESASYFSSGRLLMAKLAVIGAGDLLLLAGMSLAAMVRTSVHAGTLLFYLLLPFLVMTAACLYMLGHCSGKGFFVNSITLGVFMLLLAVVLPGRWLPLFQQRMTLGWLLFCLGLLVFCIEQLHYLLYRSPYAQLQLV